MPADNPVSSLRAALMGLLEAVPVSGDQASRFELLRSQLETNLTNPQICELLVNLTAVVHEARATEEESRRVQEVLLNQLAEGLLRMGKILHIPPATADESAEDHDPEPSTAAPPRDMRQELSRLVQQLSDHVAEWRQNLAQEGFQTLNDPLTGIAGRLGFEQRLRQEFARWKRYASPLIVQLWCVDQWESIRQQHGLQAGDNALVVVARLMSADLRETDFVARYGQEQFAVLLPETMLEDVHVVAERLRKKVSMAPFHYQGEPISITLSCGYTALEEGDSMPALLQRVHAALARARSAGGSGYSAG